MVRLSPFRHDYLRRRRLEDLMHIPPFESGDVEEEEEDGERASVVSRLHDDTFGLLLRALHVAAAYRSFYPLGVAELSSGKQTKILLPVELDEDLALEGPIELFLHLSASFALPIHATPHGEGN